MAEWNKVEDKSPSCIGIYLVVRKHWIDGKPYIDKAIWSGCHWFVLGKIRKLMPMVTHWMPLPPMPKGE